MKSFEEYEKTAIERVPFSNGTQWEIWSYNTCHGAGDDGQNCVNDVNDDCPLITLAISGRTPIEWIGSSQRYICSERRTIAEAENEMKEDIDD